MSRGGPARAWSKRSTLLGSLIAVLLLGPVLRPDVLHVSAQQGAPPDSTAVLPDPAPADEPFEQAAQEGVITPGGAFLRSVLVPGWGHVATQAYGRAGFYVAAQTGSSWMLLQTLNRRAEATAFVDIERELAETRFIASGISDPDSIQLAVDDDPAVQGREALVGARDQQVEDWTALTIFLALLGATDAFVAAHLADYPEPLNYQVLPLGGGRTEVRFSIPIRNLPMPWRRR